MKIMTSSKTVQGIARMIIGGENDSSLFFHFFLVVLKVTRSTSG